MESNNSIRFAAGTSFLVVFLSITLMLTPFSENFLICLGSSFLLATISFLYVSSKEASSNLFHPYSYFLLAVGFLSFGLPSVLFAISPQFVISVKLSSTEASTVLFLISVSFVIYHIGFKSGLGTTIAQVVPLLGFPVEPLRSQYVVRALLLYGIGWMARVSAWGFGLHHKNPNLGDATTLVSSILSPLSIFATLAFVVLLWEWFARAREKRKLHPFSWTVLALVGLEVLAGMATGSRTSMIFPLIYTAFVYNYTFERVSAKHVVIGVVMLVFVLAPATTAYRVIYFEALDDGGASVASAVNTAEKLAAKKTEWQYKNILSAVAGRFSSLFEGSLVVYKKVPFEVEFAKGSTFIPGALINMIPRILWPDKPLFSPGRECAQIFWGMSIGELYATNMGIGWVGESYYNFGWFGLFIPFSLGVTLRFFVTRLWVYSKLESNLAPRLYFAVFVVPAIGYFFYYPAGLLRSAIVYLIFLSLLNLSLPRILDLNEMPEQTPGSI